MPKKSVACKSDEWVVGSEEARINMTALIDRASILGERVIVTRNGRKMGGFVGMDDIDRLRALDAATQQWKKGA